MAATELRCAIEAILFVSGEPVRVEDLLEAFGDEGQENVEAQLQEIGRRYQESESGFYLEQTAGGYRLATRPEFDPFLRKYFSKQGEGRLSMAALETLSIVAYRQPVTAPEISEIRGVNSSGVMRTLLERKMIRIAGRKNVVGSPFLYRTTKEFLVHFGLNALQDLPRLEEFAEVLGENLNEELVAIDEQEGRNDPGGAAILSSDDQDEGASRTADAELETVSEALSENSASESGADAAEFKDTDGDDEVVAD